MDRQGAENALVLVSEDILTKTWELELQAEAAEEGRPAPDRADNQLVRGPKEGWDTYKGRRIWVKNETGQDLVVYVDKFGTIGELINVGGGVGAGATAANVEAHLELQRKVSRVQIERLGAGGGNVMFDLGRRDSAAYVTAALADNKGMLVCKDRNVPTGYCLVLKAAPFPDSVLAPQAGVTTGAVAPQQ